MEEIHLKVRGPTTAISLVIRSACTVEELRKLIENTLNIVQPFDLLFGFPPQVSKHTGSETVSSFLSNNDVIRVQKTELSGQQAQCDKPFKIAKSKKAQNPENKISTIAPSSSSMSFAVAKPSGNIDDGKFVTKPKQRRSKNAAGGSEGDIAEALVNAVSGGSGKRHRVLRSVFRNAVELQYNSAKAVSRLQAVYCGKYTIQESPNARMLGTGSSTQMEVTFHKGPGSRGSFVETVDLLSNELLDAVVKAALEDKESTEGREVLKPMNLSKCSPRIFWSLVHRRGPNLEQGIRDILRGLDDCEWLEERKRELSEKAKENLAQKKRQLEESAVKRAKKVKGSTTTECEDLEVRPPSLLSFLQRDLDSDSDVMESIAEEWRGPVLDMLQDRTLAALASLPQTVKARNELVDRRKLPGSGDPSFKYSAALSMGEFTSWIEAAKNSIFHSLWRAVCGGGSVRLRKALCRLRVRTPKELLVWKSAAEGLVEGLVQLDRGLYELSFEWNERRGRLEESAVQWMVQLCEEALSSLPWLESCDAELNDIAAGAPAEEDDDEEEQEEWQYEADVDVHMGRRLRVVLDHQYWDDGTVVGFLPPTEEEPMALWKVMLDHAVPKVVKAAGLKDGESLHAVFKDKARREVVFRAVRDGFEDLESNEVAEAIQRLAR